MKNGTRHSLARISLRWMIRECFKANTGIMFESKGLRTLGLDPSMLYPTVKPRPPPLPVNPELHQCQRVLKEPSWIRRWLFPGEKKKKGGATDPVGSEEEEDLKDALSPIYDQLKLRRAWWILEVLPLRFKHQRSSNTQWVSRVR